MADRGKVLSRWRTSFQKGTDFDSWGQLVEAVEEYQMLSRQIMKEMGSTSMFTISQKQTLQKIITCLELRTKTLQNPQANEGVSLEELRKLDVAFADVQSGRPSEFPVNLPVNEVLHRPNVKHCNLEIDIEGDEIDNDDDDGEDGEEVTSTDSKQPRGFRPASNIIKPEGTLLPRIPPQPGCTIITIHIEKIGLKDSFTYLDPFIVISVKDKTGVDVTCSQCTPVSTHREDPYILYGHDVEIQKHMEKLPSGTAIFFELKHYKRKKKAISTKCFALLEMDELKHGPVVIELYQKPTDFRRKKLNLLTNKALYLHLHLTLQKS